MNDAFPKVRDTDTDSSISVNSYSIAVDGCNTVTRRSGNSFERLK